MPTDKERLDFLEKMRTRSIFLNKKNPVYFKRCDICISGPNQCSLYARTEIGSNIEFQGHGETVREMIDNAILNKA